MELRCSNSTSVKFTGREWPSFRHPDALQRASKQDNEYGPITSSQLSGRTGKENLKNNSANSYDLLPLELSKSL